VNFLFLINDHQKFRILFCANELNELQKLSIEFLINKKVIAKSSQNNSLSSKLAQIELLM